MKTQLKYKPISSSIDPSFWNKLTELKLNVDKLNETEHHLWGFYSNIKSKYSVPALEVNSTSFNTRFDSRSIYLQFHGSILNKNTIEAFKECDKSELLNRVGGELYKSIENGAALQEPSLLNKFFILSFADLKKFHFYYWFAFPVPQNIWISSYEIKKVKKIFNGEELLFIWEEFCDLDICQKPYFLIKKDESGINISTLKKALESVNENNYTEFFFAFCDLSLEEDCPGSLLRNYITLILHHCPFLSGHQVNFLSLRLTRNEDLEITIDKSLLFNLEMPKPASMSHIFSTLSTSWVGWEKNERQKLGPRLSNMKSFLDPKELAETSVDLNLKLMKWRLLSNVDLNKIKESKYLLLGSGTLGCSVARILLGWGARHITFVDNSTVSFSNPVRQSLFSFEDSKNSKAKSQAAADNLKAIFPGVQSNSYQFTIPMPGHPVSKSLEEGVKKDVESLEEAIKQHDIIFLLMDSRESRWLPTLLGSYYAKIVINAALGFDSYLVMRHGVRVNLEEFKVRQHPVGFKSLKGNSLGCYFCNDVTAPGNSMKDRTLDQQCTVTRPGVSAIAGALAAELAISILQHKEGPKAAAFYEIGNCKNPQVDIDFQCILGLLPHCIRGYLSSFSQVLPATQRFDKCTACSDIVLKEYEDRGFEFLLKVFADSNYLEELTGLTTLNKEAVDIGVWEFSDEEEIATICLNEKSSKEDLTEIKRDQSGINHTESQQSIYVDTLDEIAVAEVSKESENPTENKMNVFKIFPKENLNPSPLPNQKYPEKQTVFTVLKEKMNFFKIPFKKTPSLKSIKCKENTETSKTCLRTLLSKQEFKSSTETLDKEISKSAQEIVAMLPKEVLTILATKDSSESSKSLKLKEFASHEKQSLKEIKSKISTMESTSQEDIEGIQSFDNLSTLSSKNSNLSSELLSKNVSVLQKPKEIFTSSSNFDQSILSNSGLSNLLQEIDNLSNVFKSPPKEAILILEKPNYNLESDNKKPEVKSIVNLISAKSLCSSGSIDISTLKAVDKISEDVVHLLNNRKMTSSQDVGLESEIRGIISKTIQSSDDSTTSSSSMMTSEGEVPSSAYMLQNEDESDFFLASDD